MEPAGAVPEIVTWGITVEPAVGLVIVGATSFSVIVPVFVIELRAELIVPVPEMVPEFLMVPELIMAPLELMAPELVMVAELVIVPELERIPIFLMIPEFDMDRPEFIVRI